MPATLFVNPTPFTESVRGDRSLPHPRRAVALLVVACALAAVLRVAETLSGHSAVTLPQLLVLLRWRMWDWSFWVVVAPIVWHLSRLDRAATARRVSSVARHAGILTILLVAHRVYSLVGMWMFIPSVTLGVIVDPSFLNVSASALTDTLTYAALAVACVALGARRARRARLIRRRALATLRRETASADRDTTQTVATAAAVAGPMRRVIVRTGRRQYAVDLSTVRWIESDGYCSRLHAADGAHLVRMTMGRLEATLDGSRFVRVHRGAIANLEFAHEIRLDRRGSRMLVLTDGTHVQVSRAKYRDLRMRLVAR